MTSGWSFSSNVLFNGWTKSEQRKFQVGNQRAWTCGDVGQIKYCCFSRSIDTTGGSLASNWQKIPYCNFTNFRCSLNSVISVANSFTEFKTTPKGGKWQECTTRDRVDVRGHRNLNFTECSVIARYRNFNAPKFCKITVFPRLRFPHGWYELWKFSFLFFMHVSRNMPTEHAVEKSWEKDKPATEILPSKMHPKAVFDKVWLPSDNFLHHRKRLTGISGCASAIQRALVVGNCDLLYSFEF